MDLLLTYNDSTGTHAPIEEFLGCNPNDCPDLAAAASPVTHVSAGDPPLLFFNSKTEVIPLSQATEMNRALRTAGVTHRLVVMPGSKHSRSYECDPVPGTTRPVIDLSVRYLATGLGLSITPTGTYCP
jgi:dipeptidyl aminopeptidase/acylaminoacyl peptidase